MGCGSSSAQPLTAVYPQEPIVTPKTNNNNASPLPASSNNNNNNEPPQPTASDQVAETIHKEKSRSKKDEKRRSRSRKKSDSKKKDEPQASTAAAITAADDNKKGEHSRSRSRSQSHKGRYTTEDGTVVMNTDERAEDAKTVVALEQKDKDGKKNSYIFSSDAVDKIWYNYDKNHDHSLSRKELKVFIHDVVDIIYSTIENKVRNANRNSGEMQIQDAILKEQNYLLPQCNNKNDAIIYLREKLHDSLDDNVDESITKDEFTKSFNKFIKEFLKGHLSGSRIECALQ